MVRGFSACVVVVGLLSGSVWAEDKPDAAKKPAVEKKAEASKADKEAAERDAEYYELYRVFAETDRKSVV